MKHLEVTAAQLRRAYRQAGTRPGCRWWYVVDEGEGYECPLHVLYGASSAEEAIRASHAPMACITGFLAGWDGAYQANPNECAQCLELGAKLRAELNPVRMASHSPMACINGFIAGWDGKDRATSPNACAQCFALGAQLRVELNPARMRQEQRA
jgi:hypothetical protein